MSKFDRNRKNVNWPQSAIAICIVVSLLLKSGALMAATKSQSEVDKLGWLTDADPKQDLELALSDSDERFIGIYGFG